MENCHCCKGSGIQIVHSMEYDYTTRSFDARGDVEIGCIWCDGSGKMTAEQAAEYDEINKED